MPHIIITFITIIGLYIGILILLYLYIMYDTYINHADDLKDWREKNLQSIDQQINK